MNIRATAIVLGAIISPASYAIDITFTEVTSPVGLDFYGQTFGQSWGDYDRDGFVDLYVSNHGTATTFYKNNGGVNFSIINDQFDADLSDDFHGGAWGDFDNDGDRDFIITTGANGGGGTRSNRFLINDEGSFVDQAASMNLDYGFRAGVAWPRGLIGTKTAY